MKEPSPRRRGAEIAVALLALLGETNGEIRTDTALRRLAVPRSSLYRAIATLAGAGYLDVSRRGVVALAPRVAELALARDDVLRREDERRLARRRPRDLRVSGASLLPAYHPETMDIITRRPPTTRRKLRLGFANAALNGPWRVALVHSVEAGAARFPDDVHSLVVRHADDQASRQADDILALARQGVDGLVISAAAGPEVAGAVAEAVRRGVALVFVDRRPAGDVPACPFVTCNDAAIGHVTGLWLAEYISGRGKVILLPGLEKAEPAEVRLAGARAAFAGFPDIEIIGTHWTGWQPRAGRDAIRAALAIHGHSIAGVWCDSGLQAVGSLKAFIAQGGGVPPHSGGDLNLAYKLALRHHVPLAAMDYPPSMGSRSVEVLIDMLRGRAVPRRVDVATEIVLTRGAATRSVRPDLWADEHVRWDLPDNLILASGLGPSYDPRTFRIHYRGNRYNRSAADRPAGGAA